MVTVMKRDKTKRMEYIERVRGKDIEVILHELREKHKDKMNRARSEAIAQELGISPATYYIWLWRYPDGNS